MKKFSYVYRKSLSLIFLMLMIVSLGGQIFTGCAEHNEFLQQYNVPPQALDSI